MDVNLLEAARDGDLPAAIAAIDAGADLHNMHRRPKMTCNRNDGSSLAWGYVKSGPDGGPGLDGRLGRCQGNGVIDPRSGKPPLLDAVGSCGETRRATH